MTAGAAAANACLIARYDETPEATLEALHAMREPLAKGLDRAALQTAMPAGAARNALDCALLDLEAKRAGQRVWTLLGRPAPRPCTTAFTISLGTPDAMASATAKAAHRPLLKIKLGGDGDDARISAVRKAAPEVRTDRGRQRSLDAGQSRIQSFRLRQRRRDAGRATAAGRAGRRAGAHQAPDRGLRRRKRA